MLRQLALRGYKAGAGLPGLLSAPEDPPQPKGPLGFKERGFSFIALRPAHLDYLSRVHGGSEPPPLDEVVGKALVDDLYLLRGVALVHLEPSGINRLYASFGKCLKAWPKDILRGLHGVANDLRERGILILHALTDETAEAEGSVRLLEWIGATPVGERDPDGGAWYRLDLRKCKI